jgi:HAD superfamily hydrolase (TIGR01509 family)
MIKALIFDLDGTLADTERMHYRAWKETLLGNGVKEFSFADFLAFVGTSNEKVAGDFIASDRIPKSVAQLIEEKQNLYMELLPEVRLMAGAKEVIGRYHRKLHLAVASSSHKKEVLALLRLNDLDSFFDPVITGDMITRKKPDPEIYLKVQEILKVQPNQCIAFEDSSPGLNSAKNAGMYGVAIPNDFTANHDFSRADLVLGSLHEIDDKILPALREKNPEP